MRYLFSLLLLLWQATFASDDVLEPKKKDWSFEGVTGKFDYGAIQRGFKVYKEVCSACHGVTRLTFSNLAAVGFSESEIKSLAGSYEIEDGPNDEGEFFKRSGRPTDKIPSPYPNEQAAKAANNGARPPDLSLIIKARKNGPNYVYSLLTGFSTPPLGFKLGENLHYNPYFSGGQLAMSPPLVAAGQVTFDDGTEATIEQMASDVVNFLQWAAEPEMEERKSLGISVMIFTSILFILLYFANKVLWSDIKRQRKK